MAKLIDLTGRRFGKLIAVECLGTINKRVRYRCICDCGNECVAKSDKLSLNKKTSCGCVLKSITTDLVGVRFGKLYVESINTEKHKYSGVYYNCICDCGNKRVVIGHNLNKNAVQSCGAGGCRATTKYPPRKHPLYTTYKGMIQRCTNPNHESYSIYGGRGVKVCDEWLDSYYNFFVWAINNGWRKGLELDKDKIPKEDGRVALMYSPNDCCFLTKKENIYYSSVVKMDHDKADQIRNSCLTAKELATMYGVSTSTIYSIKQNKKWKKQ